VPSDKDLKVIRTALLFFVVDGEGLELVLTVLVEVMALEGLEEVEVGAVVAPIVPAVDAPLTWA